MPDILLYAMQAIQIVAQLAAAGKDVAKMLADLRDSLNAMQADKRDPSAAEWAALNQTTLDLIAELNAPRS